MHAFAADNAGSDRSCKVNFTEGTEKKLMFVPDFRRRILYSANIVKGERHFANLFAEMSEPPPIFYKYNRKNPVILEGYCKNGNFIR